MRDGKIIHLRRENLDKRVEGVLDKSVSSAKLGYTWYHTHTRVGIEIPYIIKDKELLHTEFKEDHVSISFPLTAGNDFHL